MKKILLILSIICIATGLFSQNQKDTATYAFPLGCKFILELIQTDSTHYKYHVLEMEIIEYSIDYSETDTLFMSNPTPGTIECYFAPGVDQDGPFKTVLLLRNNSENIIDYQAMISYKGVDGFYKTSVSSLFPGVRSSELWNDNLTAIVLHKLENYR